MTGGPQPHTANNTAPLLSVEAFSLRLGGRILFEPVSFALEAGEIIGVQAPSGVGKTSLLRGIVALTPAHSGTCRFRGLLPQAIGIPDYRRQVVWVAQRPALFAGSVQKNLAQPFGYESVAEAFSEAAAAAWIERLGLGQVDLDAATETLSEGQRQRVCLIRAFLLHPAVLLLDEPTSALDPESITTVEQAIDDYVAEGERGAILISHDHNQLDRLCTRCITLQPVT